MSSIREVAKKAGVSIATVSRVINGADTVAPDLRQKVTRAVEICDYSPGVGRRSLDTIALIYTGPFSIGSPYDSSCLEGMVEAMRMSSYDLSIVDLQRDKSSGETLRQFFLRKGISGAVVRNTADQRGLVSDFASEGLPLAVLGDHFDGPKVPFVYAESGAASRHAVEHLIALGHKRIAFAACERDDGDHYDRYQAYKSVMEEHDLFDQTLVSRVPPRRMDGAQLIRGFLGMRNRPSAIYTADPLVAVGAINEAHSMGVRIPDELSIIGFDDTDVCNVVYPKMTAVRQDSRLLGQQAFETVVQLLEPNSGSIPPSTAHSAWLELNHTTAPPPIKVQRIMPSGSRMPS